jgi:hypothetical protein
MDSELYPFLEALWHEFPDVLIEELSIPDEPGVSEDAVRYVMSLQSPGDASEAGEKRYPNGSVTIATKLDTM